VGIWLAVDPNAGDILGIIPGLDDSLYWSSVYMMIGIGAGVFLIGFLGCVGALRAGKGGNLFLRLYFIIVKLIIITEIICIILIAVFWNSLNDSMRDGMYDDVTKKYISETSQDFYSLNWNKMQVQWKCCGSNNFTDYRLSYYTNTTNLTVPWKCCVMKDGTNGEEKADILDEAKCYRDATASHPDPTHYLFLHPVGCYNALVNFMDDNSAIIIGITCGFIGLQVLGSIMSCILMRKGK